MNISQATGNNKPVMVSALQKLISAYRAAVSPWLGNRCRYLPTCSEYASEALQVHGAMRGSLLTAKRLCRCHPWGGHGIDEVPPAGDKKPSAGYKEPSTGHKKRPAEHKSPTSTSVT